VVVGKGMRRRRAWLRCQRCCRSPIACRANKVVWIIIQLHPLSLHVHLPLGSSQLRDGAPHAHAHATHSCAPITASGARTSPSPSRRCAAEHPSPPPRAGLGVLQNQMIFIEWSAIRTRTRTNMPNAIVGAWCSTPVNHLFPSTHSRNTRRRQWQCTPCSQHS